VRVARRASVLAAGLVWSMAAGASAGLYQPPEVVVVRSGYVLLVAEADATPTRQRWISLCAEDPDQALDFDVRGLERVGHLYDSSLREERGASFQIEETPEKESAPVESSVIATSVESISFQTAISRDDGGTDYLRVEMTVTDVDGVMEPKARVRSTPVTREGLEIEDAQVGEFGIDFIDREHGHCRIPDLRVPNKPPPKD
jgi:hypothetical protein